MRRDWRNTWFKMADMKASNYVIIKSMPVMEFWATFDIWYAETKKENETLKQKKRKHVNR